MFSSSSSSTWRVLGGGRFLASGQTNLVAMFARLDHAGDYPVVVSRRDELDLFIKCGIATSVFAVLAHVAYGRWRAGDIKAISSFVMMLLGGYFSANWVAMAASGEALASPGVEAGMCLGYELYAFIIELFISTFKFTITSLFIK